MSERDVNENQVISLRTVEQRKKARKEGGRDGQRYNCNRALTCKEPQPRDWSSHGLKAIFTSCFASCCNLANDLIPILSSFTLGQHNDCKCHGNHSCLNFVPPEKWRLPEGQRAFYKLFAFLSVLVCVCVCLCVFACECLCWLWRKAIVHCT